MMAPSDVITLDNLVEKLPLWGPNDESHVYAVVDMGSNGIRFSITSLAPPRGRLLTTLFSTRSGISLFDALTPSETGGLVFPPATISAVSDTLSHFSQLAALHHVPRSNTMIFATEAMRRAENAADMLKAISDVTGGLSVNILEPSVETLFGAVMGSRSALTNVDDGALFLDLGGGSVQMTWVDTSLDCYETKAAMAGKSMPYGAAKLTRILEAGDVKLQDFETNNLRSLLEVSYNNLCDAFPKLGAIKVAYERGEDARINVFMCGGGFRGYGSMLMHDDKTSPYPISSIGTYTVNGTIFKQVSAMRKLNNEHTGKIFGMSKRRRRQFDAIATVVEAFVAVVPNLRLVTFGRGSNRDGALMMKLPKDIRESNPLEVLANVADEDKSLFSAVMQKISQAVPEKVDFKETPTVFMDGLQSLFVQQIWSRAGHEDETNASFVLHDAISRDSDTPGFSHLARAVLGLTVAARWGFSVGPVDRMLAQGLQGILDRHDEDAAFWAQYIGAIANILVKIFPIRPNDVKKFDKAISFNVNIQKPEFNNKERVILDISIAPESSQDVNPEDIATTLDAILKKGEKSYSKKVIVRFASPQN